MSVASPAISLARSRIASPRWVTAGVFFAFALGIGLWAGSIPVLMRQSGLTATGLGLAITLHSGAYILAMMGAGWLTRWVELRRLIRAGAPAWNLQRQAQKDGMRTLRQEAVEKMVAGQITLDEVRTVLDL